MKIKDLKLRVKSRFKIIYIKIFYKNVNFENGLSIRDGVKFRAIEGKIKIGKNCFFNNYCSLNSLEEIEIGDNCIFGEGVKIYDHNHKFGQGINTATSGFTSAKVHIGNNVWIGSNVTILKGVNIGENVVVGANCLIYKDIKDNMIVMNGNNLIMKEII